ITIIPSGIARALDSSGNRGLEIRTDHITGETSAWRRVRINLVDVKARVSAQLIAELAKALVTQPKTEGEGFPHANVVLSKRRALPCPIVALKKSEVVGRGIYVAESSGTIALGVEPQQEVGPTQK